MTNTVTNKGHSGSKETKNKDGAETFKILEIDFHSTLSFDFQPTKLLIWKYSVWKKSGDCGFKIIKEKKHALRLHYTLSTGFAMKVHTDIAENIKLKPLAVN